LKDPCATKERAVGRSKDDVLKLADVKMLIEADDKVLNGMTDKLTGSLITVPEPVFDEIHPLKVEAGNLRKLNKKAKALVEEAAEYRKKAKAVENAGIEQMGNSVAMIMLI
jgi:hypothetical protein